MLTAIAHNPCNILQPIVTTLQPAVLMNAGFRSTVQTLVVLCGVGVEAMCDEDMYCRVRPTSAV